MTKYNFYTHNYKWRKLWEGNISCSREIDIPHGRHSVYLTSGRYFFCHDVVYTFGTRPIRITRSRKVARLLPEN